MKKEVLNFDLFNQISSIYLFNKIVICIQKHEKYCWIFSIVDFFRICIEKRSITTKFLVWINSVVDIILIIFFNPPCFPSSLYYMYIMRPKCSLFNKILLSFIFKFSLSNLNYFHLNSHTLQLQQKKKEQKQRHSKILAVFCHTKKNQQDLSVFWHWITKRKS